jgi:hypothetical protein
MNETSWIEHREKVLSDLIADIMKQPHIPTLTRLTLVREFSFNEEELYWPVARKCDDLGLPFNLCDLISTKILRGMFRDADFDAYTVTTRKDFDASNIIEGKLYKMIRR